ncbi:TonB-dependent receptor family protein [Xylophilus sp.]|uniref:TonB-dependent receptor family protein n=1 Tax=Xylophilus sp. TaxID=2653893 RepID=UPI0013BD3D29|nr:TonB-dependent receptor [Xylophilus sp.]KAF1047545.1 MAG: Vitamin B12 transporter BtuB [Xylophilus sp.]
MFFAFGRKAVPAQRRTPVAYAVVLMSALMAQGAAAQTAAPAQADGSADESAANVKLDKIVVSGNRASEAQAKVKETPGNISVITSDELSRGRNATLADILAFQPGVVAESVGGNDAIKISVRGSGVLSGTGVFREGIKFLIDGLPVTGPGGTTPDMLNYQGLASVDVLRSGNSFQYGALYLGGGINATTHTGYTAPGFRVRQEFGSWHYFKTTLSYGGVVGDFDYYLNAQKSESKGYRNWSHADSKGYVANLGYRISPKLTARVELRYREMYYQNPGSLTLTQLNQDPRQAAASSVNASSGTRPGTFWGAVKATYTFDDQATLDLGYSHYHYPHINDRETKTGQPGYWDWHDNSYTARYSRVDQWWGHESRTDVSYNGTEEPVGQAHTVSGADNSVLVADRTFKGSYDRALSVGNDFAITPELWLTSGLAFISVRRTTFYRYNTTYPNLPSSDYRDTDWAPRVGLRYALSPDVQVFGNITRSIDPPLNWRYSIDSTTKQITNLQDQKGNTFEVGIRGQVGIVSGGVTLYRINVQHELLSVVDEEATALNGGIIQTRTFNATTPTRHQGVELAADVRLWHSPGGGQVVWRNAYTYNDNRYVGDSRLGNSRLPGLPPQFYQAKLQYDHPEGFYANLNLKAQKGAPLDYTNSAYAPGYAIWGATFGYVAPDQRWNAYLDFKNLANRKYVAVSGTTFDAAGVRDRQTYSPGDGFGVFAGVEYRF